MPSFVGAFKVVSNEGNLVTGDVLVVSPTSASKTYSGAGGGLIGDFSVANTVFSATVTFDPDLVDSSTGKVATGT